MTELECTELKSAEPFLIENDNTSVGSTKASNAPETYYRNVRVVMCLTQLLEMYAEAMIIPFYSRAMDIKSDFFGLLLTTEAIFKVISSLVVGAVVCRVGPKRCMIGTFFLNLVAILAIGFNPSINPGYGRTMVAVLSFALHGLSRGGFITTSCVIVMKVFPKTFSKEFGLFEIFTGISMAIGPFLGGFILSTDTDDTLESNSENGTDFQENFKFVGLTGAVLPLLCIIAGVLLLKEIRETQSDNPFEALTNLRDCSVRYATLTLLLGNGLAYAFAANLENYIRSLNVSDPLLMGLPWALYGLSYAIASPLSGVWSENHPRTSSLVALCVMGLVCVTFDTSTIFRYLHIPDSVRISGIEFNLYLMFLLMSAFLLGASLPAIIIATNQEMFNAVVGKSTEPSLASTGLVGACWNFAYSLSNVITPIVFGFIGARLDFFWSMRIYAILILLLLIPMGFFFHKHKS